MRGGGGGGVDWSLVLGLANSSSSLSSALDSSSGLASLSSVYLALDAPVVWLVCCLYPLL